jgi:KDO2-lipid IV(A) lauroyltransferase
MKLTSITNSTFGIASALFLSKILPPVIAYPLTNLMARIVSKQKNLEIVDTVRCNQWVIHDQKLNADQLDKCVYTVFKYHLSCLYDLYHNVNRPGQIAKKVTFSQELIELIKRHEGSKRGLLILAPHLSNFDLVGMSMVRNLVKFTILSYPNPPSGYHWQNKIREISGMEVLPLSQVNLRLAGERLKSGGIVITGLDRPMESSNYPVNFFSHSTMLPVTPIRLALKYNAQVAVCACINQKKGKYTIFSSPPIELERSPNLSTELIKNTEHTLRIAEEYIRQYPEQWAMFYPVWPQFLGKIII